MIELNKIYNEDCLEGMKRIPDGSVDCIICDLPYGTTSCAWDRIIPFDKLWVHYNRIVKENSAIVLFGTEPFSSYLRMSNIKCYKYDWIWDKKFAANFANAKSQPLKTHENISVFCKSKSIYNPQIEKRDTPIKIGGNKTCKASATPIICKTEYDNKLYETKLPETQLHFSNRTCVTDRGLHPTQKPVDLIRYLIRTYTNEGDTVLDNCMGSGTTALACIKEKRNFIGFELNKEYYEKSLQRISEQTKQQELF